MLRRSRFLNNSKILMSAALYWGDNTNRRLMIEPGRQYTRRLMIEPGRPYTLFHDVSPNRIFDFWLNTGLFPKLYSQDFTLYIIHFVCGA